MNYKRIHDSIIERAKNRKLDSYTEKHHIIPKCMNGTDDSTNLVELTAREHFIVHKLLCEIYPKEHKLLYAYWAMTCGWKNGEHIREYKISSREYERLREEYSKMLSETRKGHLSGELHYNYKKSLTDDVKKRISDGGKAYWKSLTDEEYKERCDTMPRRSGINNPMHGMSGSLNPFYGKTHTEVIKKRLSRLNKKKVQCIQENCCNNKIFESQSKCAEYHNKSVSNISGHCNGEYKIPAKFKFVK